jgi:hypothetical protein
VIVMTSLLAVPEGTPPRKPLIHWVEPRDPCDAVPEDVVEDDCWSSERLELIDDGCPCVCPAADADSMGKVVAATMIQVMKAPEAPTREAWGWGPRQ